MSNDLKFTACKIGPDLWEIVSPFGETIGKYDKKTGKEIIFECNELDFSFKQYLLNHMNWSAEAFGHGPRTEGIIKHIKLELEEVEENPKDVTEWVDIISLAIDGALREGATVHGLIQAMKAVQIRNINRKWKDAPPDQPASHIKEG